MSARNRSFGYQRERQIRNVLAKEDWIVFRPGASLGCADLIALREGSRPRLVQVKGSVAGPYNDFGPGERAHLSATARLAGADAVLAWWPARGKLRWIEEKEWPR